MSKLGEDLVRFAKEALAYARGNADPAGFRVTVAESVDVKAIRTKLKLTQPQFSQRFGIALSTLRDWEQRRRSPEGPARVLLTIIEREPDAVQRALDISA